MHVHKQAQTHVQNTANDRGQVKIWRVAPVRLTRVIKLAFRIDRDLQQGYKIVAMPSELYRDFCIARYDAGIQIAREKWATHVTSVDLKAWQEAITHKTEQQK